MLYGCPIAAFRSFVKAPDDGCTAATANNCACLISGSSAYGTRRRRSRSIVHRVTGRMRGVRSSVLRDQLIRAAMSVPTNIVEGSAHGSPHEFARYIRYSIASASEVEGHAQLAHDLGMMTASDFAALLARVVEVRMMLHGLLNKLKQPTPG